MPMNMTGVKALSEKIFYCKFLADIALPEHLASSEGKRSLDYEIRKEVESAGGTFDPKDVTYFINIEKSVDDETQNIKYTSRAYWYPHSNLVKVGDTIRVLDFKLIPPLTVRELEYNSLSSGLPTGDYYEVDNHLQGFDFEIRAWHYAR